MHLHFLPRRRIPGGFTLIEMLVVGATLAVLAGLLLPALGKTRTQTHGMVCLNNGQQLVSGWRLYTADNNDTLVRTAGLDSLVPTHNVNKVYPLNQWAMGTMDNIGQGATNTQLLKDSLLYKYVGALPAYRCPADRSGFLGQVMKLYEGATVPRVRSMSMNAWLNPINPWGADSTRFTNFRKIGGILRPSETFVTIDENPASINDGWLICDPGSSNWIDVPATYHDNASVISFADGHIEIKRWRDPSITALTASIGAIPKDDKVDLRWLQARSTYGSKGPP